MRLEFLGTGAADWKEEPFRGEMRRRTSTLIDGTLLIDGTSSIAYAEKKLEHIPAMLFTHSHSDHYDPVFLKRIAPRSVYVSETWAAEAGAQPLTAGKTVTIAGYDVTPLPSSHSTERAYEQTLYYLIEKGEDRLLYATDGAWITNRAYHIIKEHAPLTAIVFDGTVGDDYPDDYRIFEHNTLQMVRIMRASMLKTGLLKQGGKAAVTHLARTLHPTQRELEQREAQSSLPLIIAYDGMVLDV